MYNYCARVGELRKAIQKLQAESYRHAEPPRAKLYKPQLDKLRAELRTHRRSSQGLRKKDNPC